MSPANRWTDDDARQLGDRMTRLGILPSGFRAPAAPPLVASVGQVGPVALDFPVIGTPIVVSKNYATRKDRTTDVNAGGGNTGAAGLGAVMKAGFLYRIAYVLQVALSGGANLALCFWDTTGLTFATWVQQAAGNYATAPANFSLPAGLAQCWLLARPNQDCTLDLTFEANPLGAPNVATIKAGSLVDAWRVA